MKKIRTLVMTAFVLVAAVACTTPPHHGEISYGDIPVPTGDYRVALDRWTQNDKTYTNGAEALQVTATLQARELVEGQVFIDAEKFHWSQDQYRDARQKALYESESGTTFFIAVYTDKDENNNLDKSSSIWNLYLDVNGKRILSSSIKRSHENRVRIIDKFPYVNVWSNNYYVTFPIPTSEATSGKADLTIAGVLGAVHLSFPK